MSATAAAQLDARSRPPHSVWVLTALILGAVSANVPLGIANVALPSIGRELGASQAQLTMVSTAFPLGLACSVMYFGALGDKYGRKRLFVLGAVLGVPTALLSAFAISTAMLIAGRFLSGLAAGLLFPTTLSIISALYAGHAQTRAIALWSGIGSGFAAFGPLLGGLLLEVFPWGSVFLVSIPIALAALGIGWWALPRTAGEDASDVDHRGGALSVIAVASLIVALTSVASFRWLLVGVLLTVSVAAFALFFRRQRQAPRPLIDLDLASAPSFWVAGVAGTITFGSLIGTMFVGQQFTQNVLGYSALQAALAQFPVAVFLVVMSVPAGVMLSRIGGRATLVIGLAITAVAFVWIVVFWNDEATAFHIVVAYVATGIGIGTAFVPTSKALMASLPASRAGMGGAFTDLTRDFGGSVMSAIMGTALAIAYSSAIASALSDLSPSQSEAIGQESAQAMVGSIEGADQVATGYPPQIGEQIVAAAGQAFTEGKTVAVAIAGGLVVAAMALVLWKYPGREKESAFFAEVARSSRAPRNDAQV